MFGGVLGGVVGCLVGVHVGDCCFHGSSGILTLLFAESFEGCALSGATLCSVSHECPFRLKSSLAAEEAV
jgi:hypothetical protein